jgi:two-component system response regulator YesN
MRRILVVDDELPITEAISLIVRRELVGEFEIVGAAATGREAVEKALALSPDIVLMDVRMPGITGLDAIREIKKRGASPAFILLTAYERFDIAREAVGLGVLDYLLKPVTKDRLAQSLRAAAAAIERRGEPERKEIEYKEREERARTFVETAFLHGIVLGERFGPDLDLYRAALGIEGLVVIACASAFLPPYGSPDPEGEARAIHEGFRATLRYKTSALAGPLVAGRCLSLLAAKDASEAAEAVEGVRSAVAQAHARELARGSIRMGFGSPRPIEEASASWAEAMADLLGSRRSPDEAGADEVGTSVGKPFQDDESFLEALVDGSPERGRLSLERLIEPFAELAGVPPPRRYRIIALFGSAYRVLARRGLLDPAEAAAMMDLEDIRTAEGGRGFCLAAETRFSRLAQLMVRTPRWSAPVASAIAFVKESYGKQIGLEPAAEFVGISPNRLSRLFVEETGRGFSDYLIEYRIERAKELLSLPGASIKQVSASCGYPDPNYFSRLFKKVTGLTPTTFSSEATEANDEKA